MRYLSLRPGASARPNRLFGEEGCCTRERPLSRQPYALWGAPPAPEATTQRQASEWGQRAGVGGCEAAGRNIHHFVDTACPPRQCGQASVSGTWGAMGAVVWRPWQECNETGPQTVGLRNMATSPHVLYSSSRFRMFGAGVCTGIGGPEKLMSAVQPRPIKAHQRVASNGASTKRTPQKQPPPRCMSGRPRPRALRLVARLPMLLPTVLATIRHAPAARALLQPEPQVRGVAPAVGAPHVRRP